MCGIAGIVRFGGGTVQEAELDLMNAALHHRGPDGRGTYLDGAVGLGHTRLAIIDPEGGHQPFISDDGLIALVFNGEIYNYKEIRQELSAEYEFHTASDTEVLLQAYRAWGIGCLERFRGMFAFALYDRAQSLLFLVRDRIGIKPLYYSIDRSRLVFGSEMSAILSVPEVVRAVDREALSAYLRYQYVPTPMTIYEGIRKLRPAHCLSIDVSTGRSEERRYWELEQHDLAEPVVGGLDTLLDETVSIYVRSDVPFGAFLSGGVDSTIVTGYMSQHLSAPVETFSIGYEEEQYSELRHAAEAAEALGTEHHFKVLSPYVAKDTLESLVLHFGEPFADSSAVPTYQVSALAASSVKMVLSGDGGDELFAGYDSYVTVYRQLRSRMNRLKSLAYLAASHLPLSARYRKGLLRRARLPQALQDEGREIFTEHEIESLLVSRESVYGHEFSRLPGNPDGAVRALQVQDLNTYLVDDVLTKVDRMSMACSLEVRVPLLDHEVVRYALSMPAQLRLREEGNGIVTKYALKRAGERFLPWGFFERRKMGFGIPVAEWLLGPLRPTVTDELLGEDNPVFEYLNSGTVHDMVGRFFSGELGLASRVWSLLMLSMWMRIVHLGAGDGTR